MNQNDSHEDANKHNDMPDMKCETIKAWYVSENDNGEHFHWIFYERPKQVNGKFHGINYATWEGKVLMIAPDNIAAMIGFQKYPIEIEITFSAVLEK